MLKSFRFIYLIALFPMMAPISVADSERLCVEKSGQVIAILLGHDIAPNEKNNAGNEASMNKKGVYK